jgi:hypothetical protein
VLAACLAKTPSERPASMAALAERLRAALATCSPWTRQDADQWWREHPPERASAPVGSTSATFLPAGRGLEGSATQRTAAERTAAERTAAENTAAENTAAR